MNNEINLVQKQNDQAIKKVSPRKKAFEFISYGSLFVIAAASVMLFIFTSFSPIGSLRKEEETLLSQLKVFRPEIGKHFIIKDRSSAIREIIKTRNTYDVFLKDVISELPVDVGINDFVFQDTDLTVDFLTKSLSSLDLYLVKLKFLAVDKKYKDMNIAKLEYNGKEGTYLLSVNFVRRISK